MSNGFFRVCQSGQRLAETPQRPAFELTVKDFEIKRAFSSLLYKTSRFHVAVGLFSNRSQKTSKCGKNISDTLGYRLVCHFFVLTTF